MGAIFTPLILKVCKSLDFLIIRTPCSLRPRKVLLILLGVVGFLGFAHLAVYAVQILLQDRQHELGGFATFFRLGREANLPTFVSALNLLAAGLLLSLIAYHKRDASATRCGGTGRCWPVACCS